MKTKSTLNSFQKKTKTKVLTPKQKLKVSGGAIKESGGEESHGAEGDLLDGIYW